MGPGATAADAAGRWRRAGALQASLRRPGQELRAVAPGWRLGVETAKALEA